MKAMSENAVNGFEAEKDEFLSTEKKLETPAFYVLELIDELSYSVFRVNVLEDRLKEFEGRLKRMKSGLSRTDSELKTLKVEKIDGSIQIEDRSFSYYDY